MQPTHPGRKQHGGPMMPNSDTSLGNCTGPLWTIRPFVLGREDTKPSSQVSLVQQMLCSQGEEIRPRLSSVWCPMSLITGSTHFKHRIKYTGASGRRWRKEKCDHEILYELFSIKNTMRWMVWVFLQIVTFLIFKRHRCVLTCMVVQHYPAGSGSSSCYNNSAQSVGVN